MAGGKCVIWGTPAELFNAPDGFSYKSPRAGGEYRTGYGERGFTDSERWDDAARARLTTWILDQNRNGIRFPLITREVYEDVIAAKPMKMSKKVERFFLFLDSINVQMGTKIIDVSMDSGGAFPIDISDEIKCCAELSNDAECWSFKNILE